MSWIQKLYDTYEQCFGAPQFANHPLLPVSHTIQQAHVEITVDANGNFRRAMIVPKTETMIPASEKSAARTTNNAPHPLCDKIQYCASDYLRYGGRKKPYYTNYVAQLTSWCESCFSHPKAKAVLEYVRKGTVVADLIRERVLRVDDDGILLTTPNPNQAAPEIFKYLTAKDGERDQGDAFVRWRVEAPGDPVPETWEDQSLKAKWIDFVASQNQTQGFCIVLGKAMVLAQSHPKRLRHGGDGARIISSNDNSGFTFLGRFTDADQVLGVGFEVTQKAHSALRWLLDQNRKQAFRNEDQAVVAWTVSGKSLPDTFANTGQMFGLEPESKDVTPVYQGDAGQAFSVRLNKYLAGYRTQLGPTDEIVVMALDSATSGRMAITFYRELTGSEFLERLQAWHELYAWHQNYGAALKFIGAPSPNDIAMAAYGNQLEGKSGAKLLKSTMERLIPCIIDGRPVPRDIVESAVRRAANRSGHDEWKSDAKLKTKVNEWEKITGIACALFRGHHKERNYQMTLEPDRKTRDYLFGRLLAVAEHLEESALYVAGEKGRLTNASKLMQRFADRPFSTWRTIELALIPYKTRLRAKWPALLTRLEKCLDEIMCSLKAQDFMDDHRLSGEFLLGYHCQRPVLWDPQNLKADGDATENQTNQGE